MQEVNMALGNPIEAYLQAAQMKQKNQADLRGDIEQAGQTFGQTAMGLAQMKKQQMLKDMIQKSLKGTPAEPYAGMASMYPELFVGHVLPRMMSRTSGPQMEINPDGSVSVSGMSLGGQSPAAPA